LRNGGGSINTAYKFMEECSMLHFKGKNFLNPNQEEKIIIKEDVKTFGLRN
jgi:hypothetical protein